MLPGRLAAVASVVCDAAAHPRRPPKCRRAVQAVKQVEWMVMRMIGQDRAKQD